METNEVVVIALCVLGFAFIAAIAVRAERARRIAVEKAWRDFGHRTGWRFHAAAGPWFHRQEAWVEGEIAGAPCRLEQLIVRRGKSTARYTRFLARLPIGVAIPFEIDTRSFWRNLGKLFRARKVPTGETEFDAKFVVRAKSERAKESIDAALRRSLLAFPKPLEARARDRDVVLRWYGSECDRAVLDAGHAILVEMRHALGSA